MTLFLRNGKNETIVDLEINDGESGLDIRCVVIIETYSQLLLSNLDRSDEIVYDFSNISEIRRWFWEIYMEMSDNPCFEDAVKQVKDVLGKVAKKYDLNCVED